MINQDSHSDRNVLRPSAEPFFFVKLSCGNSGLLMFKKSYMMVTCYVILHTHFREHFLGSFIGDQMETGPWRQTRQGPCVLPNRFRKVFFLALENLLSFRGYCYQMEFCPDSGTMPCLAGGSNQSFPRRGSRASVCWPRQSAKAAKPLKTQI